MPQSPPNPLKEKNWPVIKKDDLPKTGGKLSSSFSLTRGLIVLAILIVTFVGLLLLRNRSDVGEVEDGSAATTAAPILTKLPFDVVDAEYSSALNRIILVSLQPQQLHIYNPETNEDITVVLSRPPASLSVSPDGLFAAVGHDARVSYIDLQHHRLVYELVTSVTAVKLALGNNGWVYVATKEGDTGNLIAFVISSEEYHVSSWRGLASALKIHPTGFNLFATSVSNYNIAQYTNSQGVIAPIYDWQQAPKSFQSCPDFWFSRDGTYLINACGDIFALTPSSTPFAYALTGTLPIQQRDEEKPLIYQMAHAAAADRLILVAGVYADSAPGIRRDSVILPTNHLLFFTYTSKELIGRVSLPSLNAIASQPSVGRFVFANTSGTAYYIIVQQGNDFGLMVGELMSMPQEEPEFVLSSNPVELVAMNDKLYFVAQDGQGIWHLWQSDGTTQGTTQLKTIRGDSSASRPYLLTNVAGTLFFRAYDGQHDRLWVSDGTPEGTHLFTDFTPVGRFPPLSIKRNYFYGVENGVQVDLWLSDGTPEGTQPIPQVQLSPNWHKDNVILNDILYFVADDGMHGEELWRTDGTPGGTFMVADIRPGPYPSYTTGLVGHQDTLIFTAMNGSKRGTAPYPPQLWRSDGTTAGTWQVNSIEVVEDSLEYEALFSIVNLTENPGGVFFMTGKGMGVTDGTEAGTIVSDSFGSSNFVVAEEKLFFVLNRGRQAPYVSELWVGNTLMANAVRLDAFSAQNTAHITTLTPWGNRVFFVATNEEGDRELWVTDGTVDGTMLFYDVNPQGSSLPDQLQVMGNQLYFVADDGDHGRELWVTDGTPQGTRLVKDMAP